MLIILILAPNLLLSINECLCYLLNQVPLFHLLHLDWFHVFVILACLFNDYGVIPGCSQSQVDGLSHSTYKEDDSFIQIICKVGQTDLSLLSSHQESYVLINPPYHGYCFNNCHSHDHFPTSVHNNGYFTSIDIYGLSSQYLDTCKEVEILHPLLMVMSGPHYLDKPSEFD